MREVKLYPTGTPVMLEEVTREDGQALSGTTPNGKTFVTRPEREVTGDRPEFVDVSAKVYEGHAYRVYLVFQAEPIRVVGPSFEDVSAWFVGDPGPLSQLDEVIVALEDGRAVRLERDDVQSLLSPLPSERDVLPVDDGSVEETEPEPALADAVA